MFIEKHVSNIKRTTESLLDFELARKKGFYVILLEVRLQMAMRCRKLRVNNYFRVILTSGLTTLRKAGKQCSCCNSKESGQAYTYTVIMQIIERSIEFYLNHETSTPGYPRICS